LKKFECDFPFFRIPLSKDEIEDRGIKVIPYLLQNGLLFFNFSMLSVIVGNKIRPSIVGLNPAWLFRHYAIGTPPENMSKVYQI
jgi:hypothetical protein